MDRRNRDMESTFLTVVSCPLCGSEEWDNVFQGNLRLHHAIQFDPVNYACTASSLASYFDIVKCKQCGVSYSQIRASDEMLEYLYCNVVDEVYLDEEEGRYRTFRSTLGDLNRWCPERGRLFEVGSYTGIFLELARESGWEVYGIEMSEWARKIARERRKLELFSSLDALQEFTPGSFNSVVMWDVIEHLPNPGEMIDQASRVLKFGGILGLSTIVLDSMSAKVCQRKYPFLMEMHLVYFTRDTLTRLLEQHGFKVVGYKRHRRYVSFTYALSKFPVLSSLKKKSVLRRFIDHRYFVSSMGLRDVYARKIR